MNTAQAFCQIRNGSLTYAVQNLEFRMNTAQAFCQIRNSSLTYAGLY
jgi:hypothetical protein